MSKHYFAQDGNYGLAEPIFLIADTSLWNDSDWDNIEMASDDERLSMARKLEELRGS